MGGGGGWWGRYIQGAYSRMYFFFTGRWAYDWVGGGGAISTGGDLSDSLTYPASTGSVSSFKQGRFSHLAIIRNFFFFQG